jgi:hypothetical protein
MLFCIPDPIPYPGVQFGIGYPYPSDSYIPDMVLKYGFGDGFGTEIILSVYIPREMYKKGKVKMCGDVGVMRFSHNFHVYNYVHVIYSLIHFMLPMSVSFHVAEPFEPSLNWLSKVPTLSLCQTYAHLVCGFLN